MKTMSSNEHRWAPFSLLPLTTPSWALVMPQPFTLRSSVREEILLLLSQRRRKLVQG